MAVGLPLPNGEKLNSIAGVRLASVAAGIHKSGRKDLLVMSLDTGANVAGVFTQNRFCAAPVQVCRQHLTAAEGIRALFVNTGNANAGTGAQGLVHAQQSCAALATLLQIKAEQILPFSTGVILEPLPIDRLLSALPQATEKLSAPSASTGTEWLTAAHTIMTTDTQPKVASREIELDGVKVSFTGISKGAGMIRPNMATMLGFIATDAPIATPLLKQWVKQLADHSFNCVSVDGDTSTNDSFILIATGKAPVSEISSSADPRYGKVYDALLSLAQELAQMIVRDGEGATKFISISVEQGRDVAECRQIAYAVAHSPLVKTAFFASDPNLGRILAAIGYAGVNDLQVEKVNLWLDDVWVARDGCRHPDYQEADGQRVMQQAEIKMRVTLGRGSAQATVWTCDLSHEYVSINADYRS